MVLCEGRKQAGEKEGASAALYVGSPGAIVHLTISPGSIRYEDELVGTGTIPHSSD